MHDSGIILASTLSGCIAQYSYSRYNKAERTRAMKFRTVIGIVLAVLLISSAAFATAQWMKTFNDTYKPKAGTALAKAKCATCHVKPAGGALNPYGNALKGKKINAASLKAVEKMDSDKDRVSNIAEIKAGTLPGDAKSKPAGKK